MDVKCVYSLWMWSVCILYGCEVCVYFMDVKCVYVDMGF